jgi:uncharacterized protein (DUF362 family)
MKNQEIHVIYGNDPQQMTYDILTKLRIAEELNPDMRIGLKPNLVVAKKASEGATTSPAIVEGVIRYLQDHGIRNIAVMESSWVGDSTKRAFKVCGYEEIARRYSVPLYDLKEDDYVIRKSGNTDIKILKKPLEVDYLVNMPVLKAHCQTLMTCALKNLKGCIPDSEKRRFHTMGLHQPIARLASALKAGLIIVDAIAGDLTFEEGGNPVPMDRIIVGKDPVLIDTYAASLLGYSKDDIAYIGMAESMGAGSTDISRAGIVEYDVENKKRNGFVPSNRARQLAQKITEKDACSACFGSLIHALQRLAEKNKLQSLQEPLYIGQAFKGQALTGIGVGQCTRQCSRHIAGCPPKAKDIVDFLENYLDTR